MRYWACLDTVCEILEKATLAENCSYSVFCCLKALEVMHIQKEVIFCWRIFTLNLDYVSLLFSKLKLGSESCKNIVFNFNKHYLRGSFAHLAS